jgi:predicted nucleotidyltransferase
MPQTDPQARLNHACRSLRTALDDLVAVYVFGSVATGHERRDSDLDLAVLTRGPVPARSLYDLARQLEVDLDVDVDLVDLAGASTVLQKEVIEKGRVIFRGDDASIRDFESRTLSEYGHFRERIDPILRSVRETGKAYRP